MQTVKHTGRLVSIELDPERNGVLMLHVDGFSCYLYYGASIELFYKNTPQLLQLIRNETRVEWTYDTRTFRVLDPITKLGDPPPPADDTACVVL
jgi:hypothetical protein